MTASSQVELGRHPDQRLVELLLLGRLGRHQLEEEVALAEDVLVLERDRLGLGQRALGQGLGDLAAQARAHRDDALVALAQERLVDPGVVVEALEVPHRVQVRQVLVADLVLGQEHQVVVAAVGAVAQVGGGDVGLAAEDHLDVVLLGLGVEVDRAEHVAVVGHRDGVHAARLQGREQVLHPDRAVQQAVLSVDVEVRELAHGRRGLPHPAPSWEVVRNSDPSATEEPGQGLPGHGVAHRGASSPSYCAAPRSRPARSNSGLPEWPQ
jgi:hypothetical protein